MSILNKFRKKERKNNEEREYIKYEDGKVIPVKIAEHKNYKEYDISPIQENEDKIKDDKIALIDKIDMPEKVKRYGTWKTLKIVGAIAIIIFFIFTVRDIYVAFSTSTPNSTTPPSEIKTETTTKSIENTSSTEDGFYQTGIEVIDNLILKINKKEDTTTATNNPNTNNSIDNSGKTAEEIVIKKNTSSDGKSSLKKAIDASNVVNTMLISETKKEIGYLNQYLDNKINIYTFEKKLKVTKETKQQLTQYLLQQKKSFEDENILSFYQVTEQRLKNGIALSETISNSLNKIPEPELISKVNTIIKNEITLKEQQNKEFVNILETKDIPYSFNKEKGQIKYTIK